MSSVLAFTYSGASIPEDPYWMRLEQVGVTSDVATISSAAAVLDALYDTDACNDSTSTENNIFTSMTDVEQVSALVQAAAEEVGIETAICDQEADGSVEVEIKAFISHPFDAHRWRITGGSLVSEIQVEMEISLSIPVEKGSSVVLDYPVVSGFSASWGATDGPNPSIKRIGNTLYWAGTVTGYLRVSYQTVHHLATVKVDGVDGLQGEAQVRCFFHGLVEEMEPELPEPAEYDDALCTSRIHWQTTDEDDKVTCYQSVAVSKKCSCSKEEVDSYTYDQVVPCPDWAPTRCPGVETTCMHNLGTVTVDEYVACTNDGDDYSDPDFYESACCHPPSSNLALPDCEEEIRTWKGGATLENGIAYWRGIYGNNLRIVQVLPTGGICGEWTIRQEILSHDCCDEVDDLAWDPENSIETITPTSSGLVYVTGGKLPITWKVRGAGFWVDAAHTRRAITTNSRMVRIYTDTDACGSCSISADDGCSSVISVVRSTAGYWELLAGGELEASKADLQGIAAQDYVQHSVTSSDGYTRYIELQATTERYKISEYWGQFTQVDIASTTAALDSYSSLYATLLANLEAEGLTTPVMTPGAVGAEAMHIGEIAQVVRPDVAAIAILGGSAEYAYATTTHPYASGINYRSYICGVGDVDGELDTSMENICSWSVMYERDVSTLQARTSRYQLFIWKWVC